MKMTITPKQTAIAGDYLSKGDLVRFHKDGMVYPPKAADFYKHDLGPVVGFIQKAVKRGEVVHFEDFLPESVPSEAKAEYGYYRFQQITQNHFTGASLSEIIAQLEACGYRCEAGPLENNLAFIELRRRASLEDDVTKDIQAANSAKGWHDV